MPRHAPELDALLAALPTELPRALASRASRKHRYLDFSTAAEAAQVRAALCERGFVNVSFDTPTEVPAECTETVPPFLERAGLRLLFNFVTVEEEAALLRAIDADAWDTTIHRRTQHYGTRFDYSTKSYNTQGGAPGLPAWLHTLGERLVRCGALPWRQGADQVTVNEYFPGMGIASHVDTHSAFEDGIAALSLGSGCAMRLSRVQGEPARAGEAASSGGAGAQAAPGLGEPAAVCAEESATLWLPSRSLVVFTDASRYEWAHSIPMRKGDVVAGREWTPRGRRVSITLRRVLRAAGGCGCAYPQLCESQGGAAIALPTRMSEPQDAV